MNDLFKLPETFLRKQDETPEVPSNATKFSLPLSFVGTIADKPTITKARIVRTSLEGKVGSRVDPVNYRGNGHWIFEEPLGGPGFIGFIYVIRDIDNNKLYIGKKQFKGLGKENKGQDSNWRWYISSSKELSAAVKLNGKGSFEYHAIEQYRSKGAVSYAETWSLMHVEAPVNRHRWYNMLVNKVSWTVKEPITERHKRILNRLVEEAEANDKGLFSK